jgi:hypothetical protein
LYRHWDIYPLRLLAFFPAGPSAVLSWQFENLMCDQRARELAAEVAHQFSDLNLEHDIAWLRRTDGQQPGRTIYTLSARVDGRLVGFAPFVAHPVRLQFGIGELTLFEKRVLRYWIESGPLISGEASEDAVAECLEAVAVHVPSSAVVFLRGVGEETPLHRLLNEKRGRLRSSFYVVPHGPKYRRCRIAWDGSFERYLETLSKVTRKDLRRTLKKASSVLGSEPELRRFRDIADVATFVRDAAEVSANTYQDRLGVGLDTSEETVATLEAAAEGGRFLGHVLYVGGRPAAFHLGFVHHGRFYMVNGGYDPTWTKAQLGILTFLKVLQDLEQERVPVTVLDYLHGEGAYKLRTSNLLSGERHYYLIKRGVRGALLAGALRASDAGSRALGDFMDRFGLKVRAKAFLRKYLAR